MLIKLILPDCPNFDSICCGNSHMVKISCNASQKWTNTIHFHCMPHNLQHHALSRDTTLNETQKVFIRKTFKTIIEFLGDNDTYVT